jgi:hypothetical protein
MDKLRLNYPLAWPMGRPRAKYRTSGKFHDGKGQGVITADHAVDRLEGEVTRLGAFEPRLTSDGWARHKQGNDVGVALYFSLKKKPIVIACDAFDRIGDNIAAIAAHIDALRGQQRWGCATLDEAFAGHLALPAHVPLRAWWDVLGVDPNATREVVEQAARAGMLRMHPDRPGGSTSAAAAISEAKTEAFRLNGWG